MSSTHNFPRDLSAWQASVRFLMFTAIPPDNRGSEILLSSDPEIHVTSSDPDT